MKQKFSIIQTQRQMLAPVMQKSITVLLMPIAELSTAIEQELQENPLLEMDDSVEIKAETTASSSTETSTPSENDESGDNQDMAQKMQELAQLPSDNTYRAPNEDEETTEKPIARETSLEEYLLQQLGLEISDPLKQKIGEQIIGNLDQNGYLKISCEEIALGLNLPSPVLVEEVLLLIQNFDPVGIAARNLKECLLIQLRYQFKNLDETTKLVIENHLEDLGKRKYTEISRKIGICADKIEQIAHHISCLEPKPARKYNPVDTNIYVKPDIFISVTEQGCQIQINNDGVPRLRINRLYRDMLSRTNLTEQERNFVKQHFENALNFLKSIKQREETLAAIVKFIVDKQISFFTEGYESIMPLTLKDVATAVERDESTVSRAIRNKYIDTPQGIYPLRFFFSHAMPSQDNGDVSTHSIKEMLKTIIEEEDKLHPLSDQIIQQQLQQKGIPIARRTIAKYRQQLEIPPANLRKKI